MSFIIALQFSVGSLPVNIVLMTAKWELIVCIRLYTVTASVVFIYSRNEEMHETENHYCCETGDTYVTEISRYFAFIETEKWCD